jgi:hypothetical protein
MATKPTSRNPLKRVATKLRELHERHEERHRPSGFDFALADRVDFLNGTAWDAVTAGVSQFLQRKVLRVIEAHGPDNLVPRYALIFRGPQPVAAVAAQLVTVTNRHLLQEESGGGKNGGSLQRLLTPAAKLATAQLNEPILVAGNLMSWGFHGIAFATGEDPAALWPSVAEALYRIRRAERLLGQTNLVLVKDLTEREQGLEALRRFSYRPMETEPNMVLAIPPAWRTYDDYLGALDAKYRRNAKDQVKKLTAAGCTMETLTDLAPHASRLHELYLAVQRNAAVRLVTLPPNFIPALSGALRDNFRCTVIRRGEQILGFVTSIRDGDTAIAYYIGFDRAAAAEGLPIYLRLLHATIADAISWGCKSLSLGRTALEPKAALGAKPESMTVWLRHRVPALNWIIRGMLGAVTHEEAPERNPFKVAADAR